MSLKAPALGVTRALILLTALGLAPTASSLPASDGGVIGWVEDAKGVPVVGALVSLFGKGMRGGGFVTLSDASGRFSLPALPPGSYTLRALGSGHAMSQQITVLPNRDSIFTLSFASGLQRLDIDAALERISPNEREWKWLLRHKRRSVLEARSFDHSARRDASPQGGSLLETLVPWVPELGGAVEWTAAPASFGETRSPDLTSPSLGSLKLNGRLSDTGRWSLGGLVADSETTSWRMAAEFVVESDSGHQLQTGAGYGTRALQPGFAGPGEGRLDNRTVGAVFFQDHWQAGERWSLMAGARYSYLGFSTTKSAFSPSLGVEYRAGKHTRLSARRTARTVTPGGDLLTLSTLQAAPAMAIALMSPDVRPERLLRHDASISRSLGGASLSAFVYRETATDRLLNQLQRPGEPAGVLRIANGPGLVVQGVGWSLAGEIAPAMTASLTYTYGQSRPGDGFLGAALSPLQAAAGLASAEASFHDVVARLETFVDRSGTRIVAYYRLNACHSQADAGTAGLPALKQRFDVQLAQDIPFLRAMTRTDWELLLAFRNMFYEASEAGLLDEIAVVNPPKRVLGGISVRF